MSERLTMFTPYGYVECDPIDVYQNEYSPENFEKILTKLGCYEDLEEEGRLIKLPCAIGDKLFFIKEIGKEAKIIVERKVVGFSIEETGTWIAYRERKMDDKIYRHNIKADDIGETVFLTKEAADAALKEREQE